MSSNQEHAAVAPDNPKTLIIAVTVVISLSLLVGIIVGVQEFYEFAIRDQVNAVEMQPVDKRLLTLHATEHHNLTSYQWIDQKAGVVRIPLDQAVELTLRDWKSRPAGTVPGTPGATTPLAPTAPAATPTTAPAPAAPQQK